VNRRTAYLTVFLVLQSFTGAYAGFEAKPEFRWLQYYRGDTRHEHDQLYASRVSAAFNYLNAQEKPLFKVIPFFEARRNFTSDLWERVELGAEAGKDVTPWLYVGEAVQYLWLHEQYLAYPSAKRRNSTESETRVVVSQYLLNKENFKLKGFFLNEFFYDFKKGAATRNEAAAGIIMPIGKHLEANVDWRHIDRIHDYDSDTVEAGATIIF